MPALQPGQTFAGVYRLVARIGRGGMGEVWRCLKTGAEGWHKEVVLKMILPHVAEEARFTEMFRQEARLVALLDHPNIVPVFHFGRDGDVLFIEQQYVWGMDLHRLLAERGGGLPAPIALFVVSEAMKGLAYAHELCGEGGRPLGIVHRDIKPHNVLIGFDGSVKLSDFGIAKATAGHTASPSDLKGTAAYIAPEVIEGSPPTQRADLFGMGLVLWEALVGRKLFDGDTDAARLHRTLECVVPPLSSVGVHAPAELEIALRRLLARDPAGRFASAADAHAALWAVPGARDMTALAFRDWLADAHHLVPGRSSPPTPAAEGVARTPQRDVETRTRPPEEAPVERASARRRSRASRRGAGSVIRLNRLARSRRVLAILAACAALGVAAAISFEPRGRPAEGSSPATAQRIPASRPESVAHAPAAPRSEPARLVSTPRKVAVRLEVDPADARVTVDGVALAGTSPFMLEGLEPGARITIRAERRGYAPKISTVVIDAGGTPVSIRLSRDARRGRTTSHPGPEEPTPSVTETRTPAAPRRAEQRDGFMAPEREK